MTNEYKGSCLCGNLTFSVSSFSKQVAHCHCTMCRKFHGAAFATLASVAGLKWLSSTSTLKHFQAENGTKRYFCSHCGSSVGFSESGSSDIEIAISCFDTDIPASPDAHIYTHHKANWCQPCDNLPSFPEGRA